MSAEKREALGQLEDAIAALVAERHGPGRLLRAWEVMVETIDPDRPDVTSWMDDGGGGNARPSWSDRSGAGHVSGER